jgi:hypothetical protein
MTGAVSEAMNLCDRKRNKNKKERKKKRQAVSAGQPISFRDVEYRECAHGGPIEGHLAEDGLHGRDSSRTVHPSINRANQVMYCLMRIRGRICRNNKGCVGEWDRRLIDLSHPMYDLVQATRPESILLAHSGPFTHTAPTWH